MIFFGIAERESSLMYMPVSLCFSVIFSCPGYFRAPLNTQARADGLIIYIFTFQTIEAIQKLQITG